MVVPRTATPAGALNGADVFAPDGGAADTAPGAGTAAARVPALGAT